MQCVVTVQYAGHSLHTVKSLCWCNNKQQGWSPATIDFQSALIVLLRHTCPPGTNPNPTSKRPCVSFGKAHAAFAFNFASADALQNSTNSLCACLSREVALPGHHVTAIQMLVALSVSKASQENLLEFTCCVMNLLAIKAVIRPIGKQVQCCSHAHTIPDSMRQ